MSHGWVTLANDVMLRVFPYSPVLRYLLCLRHWAKFQIFFMYSGCPPLPRYYPITGQVTSVSWPVIGWAQSGLTPSKRQKTGPGHPLLVFQISAPSVVSHHISLMIRRRSCLEFGMTTYLDHLRKRPPFCRWYFQMHFSSAKHCMLIKTGLEIAPKVGTDSARCQAGDTYLNVDQYIWRHVVSLGQFWSHIDDFFSLYSSNLWNDSNLKFATVNSRTQRRNDPQIGMVMYGLDFGRALLIFQILAQFWLCER